jgi:hypothetical protein
MGQGSIIAFYLDSYAFLVHWIISRKIWKEINCLDDLSLEGDITQGLLIQSSINRKIVIPRVDK